MLRLSTPSTPSTPCEDPTKASTVLSQLSATTTTKDVITRMAYEEGIFAPTSLGVGSSRGCGDSM
jgi:hypothetical protein